MRPIKRGDTEAVTRDGREVTQLTWFDVSDGQEVYGVLGGEVYCWNRYGCYSSCGTNDDIFAPEVFEWQWVVKDLSIGIYTTTGHYKSQEDLEQYGGYVEVNGWQVISRIEESKREVK